MRAIGRLHSLALYAFTLAAALAPTGATPLETGYARSSGLLDRSLLSTFKGVYYAEKDNEIISDLEVHGAIVVSAKNVTMRNVRLISATPWHALRVMEGATGFTLEDSEIDGNGATVNGIYGFGTFLRNDIHDVDNGINVIAPAVIRENFIHDLRGGPDAHYDGIEINGGYDIEIVHNHIVNDHGQTSAIMLNNEFSGLSNITIENNRLVGGGYTVYLDGRKGGGPVQDQTIRIINNQIGKGRWGDFALYDNTPVLSNNLGLP